MEEILNKANEIGLLIQETEVYKNFKMFSDKLDGDKESNSLYKNYIDMAENIYLREQRADVIENFEYEELKSLENQLKENELLLKYIDSKNKYVDFLIKVQKNIGDNMK